MQFADFRLESDGYFFVRFSESKIPTTNRQKLFWNGLRIFDVSRFCDTSENMGNETTTYILRSKYEKTYSKLEVDKEKL